MVSFPKPLKDMTNTELKELIGEVVRNVLVSELKSMVKPIADNLERIAKALEQRPK